MIVYTDKHRVPFEIDDEDFDSVSRYSWCIRHGYPITNVSKWPQQRLLSAQQFILGPAGPGLVWDHIDRNPLNNRRSNFRRIPHKGNIRNAKVRVDNKSGVKGVWWYAPTSRWHAYIMADGVKKHLGCHRTLEAAKAARLHAEQELWGMVTQ